jgi:nucleoid-associated protein YgaU
MTKKTKKSKQKSSVSEASSKSAVPDVYKKYGKDSKASSESAVPDVYGKYTKEAKKRIYVVKPGDSLSKIAKKLLGDASRWPEIYEANKDKIENPDLIYPDQEFYIPEK